MESFTYELILLLFAVGLFAGFIDTLAGGGGLITLPALMLSGIPPISALATNKLQACAGTLTASLVLFKHKKVKFTQLKSLMLSAFIGSAIGTILIQFINTDVLTYVIPAVLVLITVYFVFTVQLRNKLAGLIVSTRTYRVLIVPIIGFYDGMFGPATGSFFTFSGIVFQKQDFITSTVRAKSLNFATNVASLIIFILGGEIIWLLGGVMMLGQFLGAWGGSHMLYRINPNYLRRLVVFMCVSMLLKYSFF